MLRYLAYPFAAYLLYNLAVAYVGLIKCTMTHLKTYPVRDRESALRLLRSKGCMDDTTVIMSAFLKHDCYTYKRMHVVIDPLGEIRPEPKFSDRFKLFHHASLRK